jgi:hypothetical protein
MGCALQVSEHGRPLPRSDAPHAAVEKGREMQARARAWQAPKIETLLKVADVPTGNHTNEFNDVAEHSVRRTPSWRSRSSQRHDNVSVTSAASF